MRNMLKKTVAAVVVMWCMTVGMTAQTDSEQVLVFRNTGEINLLYASEIDSIVCSRMAADSTVHDDVVTQMFYTPDTVLVIPVAEIDSVAFGSRNATVAKDGVRMMTSVDSAWITGYDGDFIYYRKDTPTDILPRNGEKLFYGKADRVFPAGLVAQVGSVKADADGYVVGISDIGLDDVFDRLFFAGQLEQPAEVKRLAGGRRREGVDKNMSIAIDFELGDNLRVSGSDSFGIDGRVVVDALRGYVSMEADVSNDFELALTAKMDREDEISEEHTIARLPLGVYALVFTPSLNFDAFAALNAELSANLRYKRATNVHLSYLRSDWDADPTVTITGMEGEDNGTISQADFTCKGEFYSGVQTTFDFNVLRSKAGARLKLRLGPSYESEFGLGTLAKTDVYDPEVYGKAELASCIKAQMAMSLYWYSNGLWGEEKERTVFTADQKFLERKLDLFPKFFQTKAVEVAADKAAEITMATKTGNDILTAVETGFEIVDPSGNIVESVFTDSIAAGTTEVQGLSAAIDIAGRVPSADARKMLRVQPVFRYAGHVVRARQTSVMSDMMLQPMVFSQSNGAVTYLSGIPFTGSAVGDGTLYMAGPYLPVAVRDTVFAKPGGVVAGVFIDDVLASRLVGTWSGKEAGASVSYMFRADGTGSMAGVSSGTSAVSFSYSLNEPQSGRISIYTDSEAGKPKVLSVVNISETVLQYRTGSGTELYTLNRN